MREEWIKKNGKFIHICDTCDNKKFMTPDLQDSICGDCGSDNGWNKYKFGV